MIIKNVIYLPTKNGKKFTYQYLLCYQMLFGIDDHKFRINEKN